MFSITIDDTTFTAKPETAAYRGDLFMADEPPDAIFLVRVEGRTGDSFGSEDTHWDVDVFANAAEAEALADAIDLNYDVCKTIIKHARYTGSKPTCSVDFPPHAFGGIPEDRHDLIRERAKTFVAVNGGDKAEMDLKRVTYLKDGVETTAYTYSWQGYFESLTEVKVIALRKSGSGNRRRR
jgi:hypothetical protein